jgi:anaerobic selenocysteine-containing dehydrogenase
LEFFSCTLWEWGWPEYAIPCTIESHVGPNQLDRAAGEMVLLPNFRVPTLIHTRSGNAKWLNELTHSNPLWLHPSDAERIGVRTGDLIRVETEIGYFVDRVWVTEAIRPGVAACSHHLGRWRLAEGTGGERWSTALVEIERLSDGRYRLRQRAGMRPFASGDPDSRLVSGVTPVSTKILPFRSNPTRSADSTAGIRRCASSKPGRMTGTGTWSWIRASRWRSTGAGWR